MREGGKEESGYSQERLQEVADVLRENRTGLVLTGRIKNGKLKLDQATLDEIQERFPQADQAFIAMNAPFSPQSQPV